MANVYCCNEAAKNPKSLDPSGLKSPKMLLPILVRVPIWRNVFVNRVVHGR